MGSEDCPRRGDVKTKHDDVRNWRNSGSNVSKRVGDIRPIGDPRPKNGEGIRRFAKTCEGVRRDAKENTKMSVG